MHPDPHVLEVPFVQFCMEFSAFLKLVNNYSPKVILADEDKAISQAIQITFGQNTKHVLCIWHLWKN